MELTKEKQEFLGRMSLRNRLNRIARLKDLNACAAPGGIAFIGDSIVENFPTDELLRDYPVFNRGFSGDTTAEMLSRLDYTVFSLRPAHVYALIGTNDLGQKKDQKEILQNLKALHAKIRGSLPECRVHLLSVLPVNPEDKKSHPEYAYMAAGRENGEIVRLNAAYSDLAAEFGWEFVDVYGGMCDERGFLKAAYTVEGLHLTIAGYRRLTELLHPYLGR